MAKAYVTWGFATRSVLDARVGDRIVAVPVRRVLPLVSAIAIIATCLFFSPNFRWRANEERLPYAGDFLQEWIGGYVVRTGQRARLYDPAYMNAVQHDAELLGFRLQHDRYVPMVYPPVYYLLVSPLSLLPYREAAWVWIVLSLGCFAATSILLTRALHPGGTLARIVPLGGARDARVQRVAALVALPAATAFMPFAENLLSGQKGAIILLVFTSTFLALQRRRPVRAGLVFGVLAIKPQLALVVPLGLLAKGEWRFALAAAVTAVALTCASVAMGCDLAVAYLRFAARAADFIRLGPAYLHRVHSGYGFFTLLAGEPTTTVRLATLATNLLVVWLLIRLFRGPLDLQAPRFLVQFSGLVLATVLLSPHVLTYDLTVLLLPMFLVGLLLVNGAVPAGQRRTVLWLLVGLYVACGVSPSLARRTGVQLTTPIILVLLSVLALQPDRGRAMTEDPPGDRS